jgi:hypothetical protein
MWSDAVARLQLEPDPYAILTLKRSWRVAGLWAAGANEVRESAWRVADTARGPGPGTPGPRHLWSRRVRRPVRSGCSPSPWRHALWWKKQTTSLSWKSSNRLPASAPGQPTAWIWISLFPLFSWEPLTAIIWVYQLFAMSPSPP